MKFLLDVWNVILPGLPTLLGVVIGGLITYFTTSHIEDIKWSHQKKDKRLQDQRDALKQAMDWIEPIKNAGFAAAIKGSPLISPEGIPDEWPNLSNELSKMQLHPSFRFLLPDKILTARDKIVQEISHLRRLKQEYDALPEAKNLALVTVVTEKKKKEIELLKEVNRLVDITLDFEKQLQDAHGATYK